MADVSTCDECGFDPAAKTDADLVAAIDGYVRKYRAPLTRFLPNEDGPALLRRRPAPEVWSALEYAGHTRDVLAFYRNRIQLVLDEDQPQLEGGGFDAVPPTYNEADPAMVAAGFEAEAKALAGVLETLDETQWQRVGRASDGSGAERTVRVLAERAVHDAHHHLLDIGRSLRSARSG